MAMPSDGGSWPGLARGPSLRTTGAKPLSATSAAPPGFVAAARNKKHQLAFSVEITQAALLHGAWAVIIEARMALKLAGSTRSGDTREQRT